MSTVVESIRGEYLRYKALAEGALAQVGDERLGVEPGPSSNSLARIVWHVSGNLASRFTDFLTSDGEKPWRNRDEEFESRTVSRQELLEKWEKGWTALLGALETLTDADLGRTVTIRGQSLMVHEALHRSLAHTSYHVGQIVFLAKTFTGTGWMYLSIAPGASAAYNADPRHEKPSAHAETTARPR